MQWEVPPESDKVPVLSPSLVFSMHYIEKFGGVRQAINKNEMLTSKRI